MELEHAIHQTRLIKEKLEKIHYTAPSSNQDMLAAALIGTRLIDYAESLEAVCVALEKRLTLDEIIKQYSDYYASHPCAIRLRKDQVGIEPIFDNDKSKGGLWIPEQAKSRCSQGIVKYLGPQVKDIQVGDYVLFSGYNGDLVKLENELMIVMPEDFIQARVVEVPLVNLEEMFTETTVQAVIKEMARQIGPLTEMTNKLESRQSEIT